MRAHTCMRATNKTNFYMNTLFFSRRYLPLHVHQKLKDDLLAKEKEQLLLEVTQKEKTESQASNIPKTEQQQSQNGTFQVLLSRAPGVLKIGRSVGPSHFSFRELSGRLASKSCITHHLVTDVVRYMTDR